jgi:fluoroquinolone resistance protein
VEQNRWKPYNASMSFTTNNYYQEIFTKTVLLDETIVEVKFEECQFKDCSFINCKFEKCRFINCKFEGCILSAVVPMGDRLVETSFLNSKVIGVDWTKAQFLQDLGFESCQVNYSSFRMLKLPKIKMVHCEAKEVDFTEADLHEGDFTNTNFEKSIFFKTNLTKANFKGAKNYYIDARVNTISKAHFSLPEALALLDGLDVVID